MSTCSDYIYLLNVTIAGAGNGTAYGGTSQTLKVGASTGSTASVLLVPFVKNGQ
jgi:hypothetical protein